jgi:hypothetical protein
MKKLNEKKELLIDNKIFTTNELKSLIELFVKLSNEILEKSKKMKLTDLIGEGWNELNISEKHIDTSHSGIEFTSADNAKYSIPFEEISEANDILDSKEIIEMVLNFKENVLNSRFLVKIRHSGSESGSSYVMIEGQDNTWVNESIILLQSFFSSCRNQSTFVKKFRILIIGSTILILMLFLLNLVELFIKKMVMFPKIVGSLFTKDIGFYILLLSLVATAPAVFIYKWLLKLFPGIEIQTGEDFLMAEKEKYKKLALIISLIVIPAVISYLLRLL